MKYFELIPLLKETSGAWIADKGPRLGAALAFYSALSIGPLLVIILAIGGLLFAKDMLSSHLFHELDGLIGKDGTESLTTILAQSQQPKEGIVASLLSLVVLLVAASGVFGELQDALNTIWHVPPKASQPFWHVITDRFLSFAMVLGTGFLLLISLVITATLNGISDFVTTHYGWLSFFMGILDWCFSLAVSAALFALIFKKIPDIKILWKDVIPGALLTALLFSIGKILIGLYLGHSAIRTTYGAAGSFMVFLVWVYYSAQILYFGAEFTKVQSLKEVKK